MLKFHRDFHQLTRLAVCLLLTFVLPYAVLTLVSSLEVGFLYWSQAERLPRPRTVLIFGLPLFVCISALFAVRPGKKAVWRICITFLYSIVLLQLLDSYEEHQRNFFMAAQDAPMQIIGRSLLWLFAALPFPLVAQVMAKDGPADEKTFAWELLLPLLFLPYFLSFWILIMLDAWSIHYGNRGIAPDVIALPAAAVFLILIAPHICFERGELRYLRSLLVAAVLAVLVSSVCFGYPMAFAQSFFWVMVVPLLLFPFKRMKSNAV